MTTHMKISLLVLILKMVTGDWLPLSHVEGEDGQAEYKPQKWTDVRGQWDLTEG